MTRVGHMRVAFLAHDFGLYGASRSLLDLIEGLDSYGVQARVVIPDAGALGAELERRNVPFAVAPLQWWMSPVHWRGGAVRRLVRNVRLLPRLTRLLRSWRSDIVYTNSSVIPVGAMLARCVGRPHVWHLREFGELDYGLHHDWGVNVFRRVIRAAQARIAISEAVRAALIGDIATESTWVIYNGVASQAKFDALHQELRGQAIREGATRHEPYTFALVGVVHPTKGQQTAIRALSLLRSTPPPRLLIVGGGGPRKYLEACRRLAHELALKDRVEFWGYVHDPYTAYRAADAVLMCSEHEGMGRTTAEAMSACRPVIGLGQGGTVELVEHERTGLLYSGGPEALAACMKRFMENPRWARGLGMNGWCVARQKYTTERYAQQVYEVLETVTSRSTA